MDGQSDRLLKPGEVAALFRVDPKTVTRWARLGWISSIRTPGGHRRYRESEVRAILGREPYLPPDGRQLELAHQPGERRPASQRARRRNRRQRPGRARTADPAQPDPVAAAARAGCPGRSRSRPPPGHYIGCSSKTSMLNRPLPSDRNGWSLVSASAASRLSACTIE
jgi:MerR family regulatory protein